MTACCGWQRRAEGPQRGGGQHHGGNDLDEQHRAEPTAPGAGRRADRGRGGAGTHAHADGSRGRLGRAPVRPGRPADTDPLRRGGGRVRLRHRAGLGRQHRDAAARAAVSPPRTHATNSSSACPHWSVEGAGGMRPPRPPSPPARRHRAAPRGVSPTGRSAPARVPGRPPRRAWGDRARRPTVGPARSRRPARSRP